MGLSVTDWCITAVSLAAVIGVALWTSSRKRRREDDAPTSYFLAGRNMPWWVSAASLFASNLGTEHFVGQAGLAATSGIAVSIYEWAAVYLLVLLGWFFAPVYLKLRLKTIPEYLERRFDHRCRLWFVVLTMATYASSKIGASLFSGAVVLDVLADLNLWTSTSVVLIATALYTALGGLTAVMFTDVIQTVIFTVGGVVGAIYSLHLAGGISDMKETLKERDLNWFLHNLHPIDDKDFPWLAMTVGLGVGAATYYWCVDQEMTQRVLSAKSLDHAQLGCVTAGYLKILPMLITIMPGIVARVLYERCLASEGAEFRQWCSEGAEDMSDASDSNKAYPLLVLREFPVGLKGILVAAFLAAMMSSLSSVFNSASTIITYDVYLRFLHPDGDVTAERLVTVGRVTTVLLTVLSLLWLPIIQSSNDGVVLHVWGGLRVVVGLYLVTQSATSHLVGPLSALFLVALLWPRANASGVFIALILNSGISVLRLVLTVVFEDYCDDYTRDENGRTVLNTTWQNWFICMNFNHFAILLFTLCVTSMVLISYAYPAPDPQTIQDCLFVWPEWIQYPFKKSRRVQNSIETSEKLLEMSPSDAPAATSAAPHEGVPMEGSLQRARLARILAVVLIIGMTILIGVTH